MMSAGMPLLAASPEKKENKTAASADALPTLSLEGLPEVWLQGTPVKEWEKDKVYIFEILGHLVRTVPGRHAPYGTTASGI